MSKAFIAGIYEYPHRAAPATTVYAIKAECASKALEDAGLAWSDVDALYDCGEGDSILPGIGLAEYLGLNPDVIEATDVGGASYELHVAHALRDISTGRANVALITYGSLQRQQSKSSGGLRTVEIGDISPVANMERPYGLSLIGNYALVAQRHIHEFGTTPEQLANIAVIARTHALRNPAAIAGLESLGIRHTGPLTVDKILASRTIADPIHLLECCLLTDGGGAIVVVSHAVAQGIRPKAVEVLGAGEAVSYLTADSSITTSAAAQSGPKAFGQAGVKPADIDVAMIYDSFTITVLTLLEDLGFCAKGDGGPFVESGVLAFDAPGGPAVNTDGGGLSSNHPGMRGIFLLIEATRQLRGESTSQVPNASLAIAHGNGGFLGTRHAAGTVILGAS